MPKADQGRVVKFSKPSVKRTVRQPAIQEAISRLSPTRQAAIRDRASQMPKLYRPGYLRAVSGMGNAKHAIKAHCLECMGWDRAEITRCTAPACPLYGYCPFQT